MEKILLIFLFFVSWTAAKAQDKIITSKHDTIECRIVSVNAERIGYEQKTDEHFVGKSIPISEVLHYFRTGKSESLDHEKPRRERPEHRWLFSLQGGLARSLTDYSDFENSMVNAGNSESAADDYTRKLKNGTHINTSLHYLVSSSFGFGLDYNLFHSASKGEFLSEGYSQGYGLGYGGFNLPLYTKLGLDERQYSHFAGPSVLFQQFPDKKKRIKISETIAPGIVLFRNESRDNQFQTYWGDNDFYSGQPPQYYNQANSVIKSTTFGAKGSLAIEYGLTPQLSAGLAGNFMWAELKKISVKYPASETNDQELAKTINISHIDYGFTVRYNF